MNFLSIRSLLIVFSAVVTGTASLHASDVSLIGDTYTLSTSGTAAVVGAAVGGSLTISGTARTWIKFDVDGALPPSPRVEQIQKATLKIFINSVATGGSGTLSVTAVGPTTPLVTEANATYSLIGAGLPDPFTGQPYAAVGITSDSLRSFVTFDITELVRDWVVKDLVNNGLILSGTGATNLKIDSKESITTAHPPSLDVIYAPIMRVYPRGGVSMGAFTNPPLP